MTNVFGDRIRALRKEKGFTLDKLAELTQSSKSYIWELENKNPPRPSAEKLSKIAELLDTTVEYLLYGESDIAENASHTKFFRQYKKMPPETQEKIRQIAELWGKK